MKRFLLFIALVLAFIMTASADTREKISPEKICIGTNKCVGSAWSLVSVEKFYGVRRVEIEEGVKEVCILHDGIYIRLQYDQRSVAGLKSPAALEVASNTPPKECQITQVKVSSFSMSPITIGDQESKVKSVLGEPDEVWDSKTSDHGIFAGERGFVYSGKENAFVLVVLRNQVVVRVTGSVLP